MVDENAVKAAENAVRDTKNWLAVLKTEHNLTDDVVEKLHEKLDEIGRKIGAIE